MRPDMKKVIVERPRVQGHGYRHKNYTQVQISELDLPTKESMTRPKGWERKEHSDLLGPLWKFLVKNKNRKWNDVWSEICENNKDFMGSHLKRHIHYMVEFDCVETKDGVVDSRGLSIGSWHQLYVNQDGILKYITPSKKSKKRDKLNPITIGNQTYYQVENIWYRVTFDQPRYIHAKSYCANYGDIFGNNFRQHHQRWVDEELIKVYGKPVICVYKQQANKKECKKIRSYLEKLTNQKD